MRAGALDRIVVLQRSTESVDPSGATVRAWTDFATVRAELASNAMIEVDRTFGEAEQTALTFRIRYWHGLTTADRLVYRGDAFDITGIVEIGRRRGLELRCEAVS